MKNTQTFTSTISPNLIGWLNEYAKKTNKTRRDILEDAIVRYKKDVKRKAMADGFRRAVADTNMDEMTEWGMEDYVRITKKS